MNTRPGSRKIGLRDVIVAASLANLLYLCAWEDLAEIRTAEATYLLEKPVPTVFLATILIWAAVTVLIVLALGVLRRTRGIVQAIMELGFIAACLCALYGILPNVLMRNAASARAVMSVFRGWPPVLSLAATVAGISALVFGAIFRRARLFAACEAILAVMTPFAVVTVAGSVYELADSRHDEPVVRHRTATPAGTAPHELVVWLLFDEMDQETAFEERPEGVELPNFDRLRADSFVAVQAFPPGRSTREGIPSLTTGRVVAHAGAAAADDLRLNFKGASGTQSWRNTPNIFSEAAALGRTTALAGYYHPYCRVFPAEAAQCEWWPEADALISSRWGAFAEFQGLRAFLPLQVLHGLGVESLEGRQATGFIAPEAAFVRAEHERSYREMRASVLRTLADPRFDFFFIHLALPHPPGLEAGRRHALAPDYFSNLELADDLLGEIRTALEKAARWPGATLLVSTDHPFRSELWSKMPYWTPREQVILGLRRLERVPFVLKLPGDNSNLRYERPFNTVLSYGLLVAIFRGELRTPAAVARWLDART